MATTFRQFSNLPAELRGYVWAFAHENEKVTFRNNGRTIELHDYDRNASTIRLTVTKQYPTLFAVSRESRYEVAKLEGGEWIKPDVLYDGGGGSGDNNNARLAAAQTFEIYFNFDEDEFFLSERFSGATEWTWTDGLATVEEYRLSILESIMGYRTLQRLQNLALSTVRPPTAPDLWWKGDGLEVFEDGALKTFGFIVNDISYGYHIKTVLEQARWDIWTPDEKNKIPVFYGFYVEDDDYVFYNNGQRVPWNSPADESAHILPFDCHGIRSIEVAIYYGADNGSSENGDALPGINMFEELQDCDNYQDNDGARDEEAEAQLNDRVDYVNSDEDREQRSDDDSDAVND